MIRIKATSFFLQTPRNFQSLLVHGIECMLALMLRSGVMNDLPRFLPGLCNSYHHCQSPNYERSKTFLAEKSTVVLTTTLLLKDLFSRTA